MTLFKLTTRSLGNFYVLANDATEAKDMLEKSLDEGKYGFYDDRRVNNIEIVTNVIEQGLTKDSKPYFFDKFARLLIVNDWKSK